MFQAKALISKRMAFAPETSNFSLSFQVMTELYLSLTCAVLNIQVVYFIFSATLSKCCKQCCEINSSYTNCMVSSTSGCIITSVTICGVWNQFVTEIRSECSYLRFNVRTLDREVSSQVQKPSSEVWKLISKHVIH